MSEEKRKFVISGRSRQILYTGIVCVLVCFLTAGVTVFLTKEKKEETKEVSAQITKAPEENTGYAQMETNPLEENSDEKLTETVEAYYRNLSWEEAYAEAYDGICIYTKDGKIKDSKILYVRYQMKIRGIYTEVPGLGTLYATKDGKGGFEIQDEIKDEQTKKVIEEISRQTDVQELFAQVEADYEEALSSDQMLAQAVEDLENAADQ